MDAAKLLPVKFTVVDRGRAATEEEGGGWLLRGRDSHDREADFRFAERPADLETAEGWLVSARYDTQFHRVEVAEVLGASPAFSFPFIPGLEERAKIIFFHVPMAWMTVIAFLVSMWYGIRYLRKKDMDDDFRSAASAGLGLLFCILGTTTGSLWAKFNWGSFWNWDPRETSIFVLLLVYGAYFALRSAIEIEEKRAALSAVYSIIAAATVPFFVFIMPRLMPGLHPGSADDSNAGPVLSSGGMDTAMRMVLYSMLAGFLVLYGWLMSIQMRLHRIKLRRAESAA
ncbi:MAG: cytochrome c biogenesis protein CcsA [Bacteroidetes bacterium]|nr:cytochrome c biogenesis protein CcsA [Bacteroidota bacterium]